jgi:hypothetical protein
MKVCVSLLLAVATASAQIYSPKVLRAGQPDSTDLRAFASEICRRAGATTDRQKAEAIWRYFLTDGRFVTPGFWYHIAGWAYEEPTGEVLDPMKLLNSYGFGLCYQVAPLLEAVWEAAGFSDARVWFITGHTVAEVYYDGSYHHYDSDLMGYNEVGGRVVSVEEIERNPALFLSLKATSDPWYPGDVRAGVMRDVAELFSTTKDNWLFPFTRYAQGHTMDFVLRPGERMVRYFQPENPRGFYLPYKYDGHSWSEFPTEVTRYHIRTEDGPHSQRDERKWGTGVLEYRPPAPQPVYEISSPYVIIDAEFSADSPVTAEVSTDEGATWRAAAEDIAKSEHGRHTAVSGSYRYLVRFREPAPKNLLIRTRFQLNPRSLPGLAPGRNEMKYMASAPVVRRELAVASNRALRMVNARQIDEGGQRYLLPKTEGPMELVFALDADAGFDAGARFLDLRDGIAPDKFTAETRKVQPYIAERVSGSIAWSTDPDGPWQPLWDYAAPRETDRVLRWPEVDRSVRELPAGAKKVYIRYRAEGLAIDTLRLASLTRGKPGNEPLQITHVWREAGRERRHVERITDPTRNWTYAVDAGGSDVRNESIAMEVIRRSEIDNR